MLRQAGLDHASSLRGESRAGGRGGGGGGRAERPPPRRSCARPALSLAAALALAAAAALALAAAGLVLNGAPELPAAYAQQPGAATWQSVANVTSDSGAYGEGRTINVTVAFDAPVGYSVDAPVLQLNVSGSARAAAYASGNDSSRLVFSYAVGPGDYAGDLDYHGTGALAGDIRYRNGTAANLTLPAPGTAGSLSETSDVVADHAAPLLVAAGWVDDADDGFGALDGANDVAVVAVGGRTYALVSAEDHAHAVQMIRVHDNGSLAAAGDVARHRQPGYNLDRAFGIDAVSVDGAAYAFATPYHGHGTQMISVRASGTMEPAGFVPDNADRSLYRPAWPAAFEMNGAAHVLVGSYADRAGDGGVQLLRVADNGGLEAAGRLNSIGGETIEDVFGLSVFDIGDEKHALVSAVGKDAVHLIRIHGNGSLSPVDSLSDNTTLALNGPHGSDAFSLGGRPHVLVATGDDPDGDIQLIRIGEGGMLEAAGLAGNGAGFAGLDDAEDVSVVGSGSGGGVYALVGNSLGIQLVYVRGDDGALLPAGSAGQGDPGFGGLANGYATAVFGLGGGTYAAVVSSDADGVQLIRMSPAAPVRAYSTAPGGAYGTGSEIDIAVEFDGDVRVEGPLELRLNTGRAAALVGGNETGTLVFRYVVRDGDSAAGLEYEGTGALAGAGAITDVAAGVPAGRALPPPGSGMSLGDTTDIAVDGGAPPIVSVGSATANGTYGLGDVIEIGVVFDAPVQAAGPLEIRLNSGGAASYASGGGPETLVFRYEVREGEQAADLDYLAGAGSLSGAGTITGAETGLPAGRALPPPGSGMSLGDLKDIAVDARAPSVESVSAPAGDGVYGAGSRVNVTVTFDEPVRYSGPPPELRLDVGGEGRRAAYASGNGTSEIGFSYAVRAGDYEDDLGYLGTAALSGKIADAVDNAADLALPRPGSPGSLAGSSDVLVDHGMPRLIGNGSAAQGAPGFGPLGYTLDVDTIAVNGSTYAAVAGLSDNIQTIRVHGNGTLEAAGLLTENSNPNNLELLDAYGVDAFYMDGSAYAIVASQADSGVQLARILANGTLVVVDSLDDNSTLSLGAAVRVAAFEMDGAMHAIVAAGGDDSSGGVQLVRISEDGLEARGSLADNSTLLLGGAYGVDVFGLGGRPHALVSGEADGGVQLVRINADGSLSPMGSLRDNTTLALGKPHDVAAFDLGGRPHALVASEGDDGVQLLRIRGDGSIEAVAGPAIDEARGFDELNGAFGVDAFQLGGDTYALATGRWDNGLQMIRVRAGDGAMLSAGSAAHGSPGFLLNGAFAVDAFTLDGRPYAMAVSAEGGSVQLARLSPVAVANVTTAAATGTYEVGDQVNISVAFDGSVVVAEPLGLRLNTGGAAEYASGTGTGTLVFTYEVADGDRDATALEYDGMHALRAGPGGSITESGTGLHARAVLPPPGSLLSLGGSASIAVDTPPAVASVSSPNADGAYGIGDAILVNVTFDEPVLVQGSPRLTLDMGGANRTASYDSGSNTTGLLFAYTVAEGDASDGLGYAGRSALSLAGGASIEDRTGNAANLTLPAPGSPGSLAAMSALAVDGARPAVASVSSPNASGTYGLGEEIHILVNFTEPVLVRGSPLLALDMGGANRTASYESGSNTTGLLFAYTVAEDDMSDGLDYAGASALSLGASGSIEDAAGNAANLALPAAPGSLAGAGIAVDGTRRAAAAASAAFVGPNTVRIDYTAPLGPPAGHEGPVYGGVSVAGGAAAADSAGESGLGTRAHTVGFGGDGVGRGQSGAIELLADLVGQSGGVPYAFAGGSIPVRAGSEARTLAPAGAPAPVVAIERDGFVRAVDATAAGNAARPAINVSGLVDGAAGATGEGEREATMPNETVSIIASFAAVSFPPNATAAPVPADGLLELYVSPRPPTAQDVAGGFGAAAADVEVLAAIEAGDNATHIRFSMPVRILLAGQANASAFYVNGTTGAVVPIAAACGADDTAAVHGELGGSGACRIDSADGGGLAVHTYHLTQFGAARVADGPGTGGDGAGPGTGGDGAGPGTGGDGAGPGTGGDGAGPGTGGDGAGPGTGDTCSAALDMSEIAFDSVKAGERSATVSQGVKSAGMLNISSVSISATAWTAEAGDEVMPAGATQFMAGDAAWTPLGGEAVGVQSGGEARSVSIDLRLVVPPGTTLPDGASSARVSQNVTYTVECAAPAG